MRRLGFGRIERLEIREGEPVMASARVVQEIKLGACAPLLQIPNDDFELKFALVDLFQRMASIEVGQMDVIEVRHGLPFRLIIELRAAG